MSASTPSSSVIDSMSDGRKFLLFATMALGMFMALLDTQIVAASIADIQSGLAAAPDESSWVQTAYLMAEIVMIPFSGWLSRTFSTRWLFSVSALGFTLSSIACGFAGNISMMIVARAIQGFIGGAMIPTAFATGFSLFKGKKQAIIPATLGLLGSLAPTIGPTLGGWITDTLSWRWLFFVNIAPGLFITFMIPRFGAIDEPDLSLLRRFDVLGLGLLAVFLGSLEYVLEEGYRWNWLDDDTIRNLTWISVIAGVLFVWRSLAYSSPIVDLRALKNKTFALASLFNFITGFGMFSSIYVLPLFLDRVAGFDARQIGEAVFVAGLSQILGAPLVATLSRLLDLRLMMAFGFSMFALGLWMSTSITSQWTGDQLFWAQVLRGFSILFCIVPATNMALGALPPAQLKMSSALFNTMRNLGGAIGIACVNTWINGRTNKHWHDLAGDLTTANPKVQSWLANVTAHLGPTSANAGQAAHRAMALLAQTMNKEAVTMAFADVFHLMAMLFFGALIFVPLLRRPKQVTPAVQEAAH
jgi:MFS transporter, DHA2 family, multidrug resistance protein